MKAQALFKGQYKAPITSPETSNLMTPVEKYKHDLKMPGFSHDPAQEMAVQHLQRLYDALIASEQSRRKPLNRLRPVVGKRVLTPVEGLYFWGGVGRGKTYLLDLFYESLPLERKMRIHFHRFMKRVHNELAALQGERNPLSIIGARLAREAVVLCFDEFFVSDITDAMILGELMDQLFSRGVTLVTTSNIVPSELYKDGLQRDRFLPAIELIEQLTTVVNVDHGVDYRLRALEKAEIYHSPLDEGAEQSLRASFESLAPEPGEAEARIEIEGREIQTISVADDVLWCDFRALCDGPRSQNDYIELARIYHAVLISNVPALGAATDDMARRFINLVDEFYDRGVKLIISAEAPVDALYADGNLAFEFERTRSRLVEMRSHDYLARGHRP